MTESYKSFSINFVIRLRKTGLAFIKKGYDNVTCPFIPSVYELWIEDEIYSHMTECKVLGKMRDHKQAMFLAVVMRKAYELSKHNYPIFREYFDVIITKYLNGNVHELLNHTDETLKIKLKK